jgi:4-hydroxy-3-methylbut-2-enyl diphosphate reductase
MYLIESVGDVWQIEVKNPDFLAYVTQTTLSVDDTAEIVAALRKRFPKIVGPKKGDICYAAQNRQSAVKRLVDACDLILVVGSRHSHNSARIKDFAVKHGVPAYLIDNAAEMQRQWLEGVATVGVTAGASVPEILVKNVVARLYEWGGTLVSEGPGGREEVVFSLPHELAAIAAAA